MHFAKLGANVVISGRDENKIRNVFEKCRAESPNIEALTVMTDLTQETGCRTLITDTVAKFGKIDVLVNNAGIGGMARLEESNVLDTFDRVYATNVRPVVLLCHLALPYLTSTKGCIVNVSSCAGLRPYVGGLSYCSSKSALDMIARVMALELGPQGVRVNNVNPAIVRTPIFEAQGRSDEEIEEIYSTVDESYPLGRPGEPVDIAKAIAFLASDDAAWVSGLTMWVDGGSLDCSTGHAPKGFLDLMNK